MEALKVNDIRIGNLIYIYPESTVPYTVDSVRSSFTDDEGEATIETTEGSGDYFVEDCRGIPLTPEWLEKFGFRLESEANWKCTYNTTARIDRVYCQNIFADAEDRNIRLDCILDPKTLEVRRIGVKGFNYSGMSGIYNSPIDIRFVHTFQNLYYSLTGVEIEMKQPATA